MNCNDSLVFPHVGFDVEDALFDGLRLKQGILTSQVVVDTTVVGVGLTGDEAVEIAGDENLVVAAFGIIVVDVVRVGAGKDIANSHVVHGNPETDSGVALHIAINLFAVLIHQSQSNDTNLHTGVLLVDVPVFLNVNLVVVIGGEVLVFDGVVAFVNQLAMLIVDGVGHGRVCLVQISVHVVPINGNL